MKTRENKLENIFVLPFALPNKQQELNKDNLPKSKEEFNEQMQRLQDLVTLQQMAKILELYFS